VPEKCLLDPFEVDSYFRTRTKKSITSHPRLLWCLARTVRNSIPQKNELFWKKFHFSNNVSTFS